MSAYNTDRYQSFFVSPGPLWQEGTVVGPTRPSFQLGRVGKRIRSLVGRGRAALSSGDR